MPFLYYPCPARFKALEEIGKGDCDALRFRYRDLLPCSQTGCDHRHCDPMVPVGGNRSAPDGSRTVDGELILPRLKLAAQSVEPLGHLEDPVGLLDPDMGDVGERRRPMRLSRRHDKGGKRIGDIRKINFLQGGKRFPAAN